MHVAFLASAFVFLTVTPFAHAQTRPSSANRVDPTIRRDQLAEVNQKLADPDPDARTSYMESIIASGDTTLINKAISVAMRSDDAALHNLALRAFMASIREITFTVNLPEKLKTRIDAAEFDPEAKKQLDDSLPWIPVLQAQGGAIQLGVYKYSASQNTGGWSFNTNHNDWGKWAPADVNFTITGDHLTSAVNWGRYHCNLAVRATSMQTLQGTLMCGASNPPIPTLPISAPMQ